MPRYIKPLIAALAVLGLSTSMAACGATSEDPPSTKAIVSPAKPISLSERIDISETTADKTLRERYLAAGMQAAEAVMRRGGQLSLQVFFSRGLAGSVKLLDTPVPSPSELGGVARAQKILPIKAAAESALAEALNLAPRQPAVARALKGLGGEGTDITGALAGALTDTRGQPNSIVLTLTDGADVAFTGHYGSNPADLAARITPELPRVGPGVVVALLGVGGTAQGTSTALTERLLKTWRLACAHTGARCYVSPETDLTRLLG